MRRFAAGIEGLIGGRGESGHGPFLRRAPVVDVGDLVHAGNGAMGCASFFGEVLAADVVKAVSLKRHAGIAALLRAVVDQAVLAYIKIAGAGATSPVVGASIGDVLLEVIELRVVLLLELHDLLVNRDLFLAE